jgi:signal transduction histidine kinase
MPRLFYKIFLWFWLGIAVVSATLVASTVLTHSRSAEDERWRQKYGPMVDLWAQREAEVFDHDGRSGLEKYIASFVKDPGVYGFIFDGGQEVLGRQAPPRVLQVVALVSESSAAEPRFFTEERIIGEKAFGPSGRPYVVVVTYPAPPIVPRPVFQFLYADLDREGIIRLVAVLIVAAFFSFWLTRQITSPIDKLRWAARQIANEHLDARVDKTVLSRRDELADLGRDFDRMAQRIDALVTAQRRLLADVSHTLRSPLARLSVALGLVREGADPETSEHLDRIERETDRLNKLIGQLLTMARVDSGVDLEQKKVFDLGLLMEEVAADGDYEARSRNCAVEFSQPAECMIEGAPEMLRSAVENVVRNAVRYTAEGTNVLISMECHRAGCGSRAIIQVRDHGAGVPDDAIAELFLPFHQLIDGMRQDGTGLGLAITERAFRLHGGNVTAANAPGGGLVVTLELPTLDSNYRPSNLAARTN